MCVHKLYHIKQRVIIMKKKLSFKDRMKNHDFADDELKCHHIHCETRFSEVLDRDAKYCLKCENFLWE